MRYTTGLPNFPPGHVQKCAIMLDLFPRGSPKLTCILIVFYIFILSMSVTIRYIVFQDIAGSKDHKLKQRKSYLCPLCSFRSLQPLKALYSHSPHSCREVPLAL